MMDANVGVNGLVGNARRARPFRIPMSVWVFVALGWASGAETPTELACVYRAGPTCGRSSTAFTACASRESRGTSGSRRYKVAVNSDRARCSGKSGRHRQSAAPPGGAGWRRYRDRRWGLRCGFGRDDRAADQPCGAVSYDGPGRDGRSPTATARKWWGAGSVIGGWPLLLWAFEVSASIRHPTGQIKFGNVFTFNYWCAITEPFD